MKAKEISGNMTRKGESETPLYANAREQNELLGLLREKKLQPRK